MPCPNCDTETDQNTCPECGTQVLSDMTDMMDQLVADASIPNLAALFKAGKDKGLIKPGKEYGHPA